MTELYKKTTPGTLNSDKTKNKIIQHMKKLIIIALCALSLTACTGSKKEPTLQNVAQNDSLERIIAQRDNEINDMMSTLNDIQEGFREINEAENRVSIAKDGEGSNKAQQIRENIRFIAQRMQQNRELIAKLKGQLKKSGVKGEALRKTVEDMARQLDEKDQELQQLRAELDAKDIHIAELDETINNLNTNVSNLQTESSAKSQTIKSQDTQLNTAWFVFGTKNELKEQGILVKGKVMQGSFNKSYFTKIDIRVTKEVKLYSKYAKILTMHPSGSYSLAKDATGQYVLNVTNPQIFWSTSKYLVILVK